MTISSWLNFGRSASAFSIYSASFPSVTAATSRKLGQNRGRHEIHSIAKKYQNSLASRTLCGEQREINLISGSAADNEYRDEYRYRKILQWQREQYQLSCYPVHRQTYRPYAPHYPSLVNKVTYRLTNLSYRSVICLQCSDTVGWATGMASVLFKKLGVGLLVVTTGLKLCTSYSSSCPSPQLQ